MPPLPSKLEELVERHHEQAACPQAVNQAQTAYDVISKKITQTIRAYYLYLRTYAAEHALNLPLGNEIKEKQKALDTLKGRDYKMYESFIQKVEAATYVKWVSEETGRFEEKMQSLRDDVCQIRVFQQEVEELYTEFYMHNTDTFNRSIYPLLSKKSDKAKEGEEKLEEIVKVLLDWETKYRTLAGKETLPNEEREQGRALADGFNELRALFNETNHIALIREAAEEADRRLQAVITACHQVTSSAGMALPTPLSRRAPSPPLPGDDDEVSRGKPDVVKTQEEVSTKKKKTLREKIIELFHRFAQWIKHCCRVIADKFKKSKLDLDAQYPALSGGGEPAQSSIASLRRLGARKENSQRRVSSQIAMGSLPSVKPSEVGSRQGEIVLPLTESGDIERQGGNIGGPGSAFVCPQTL